MCGGVGLHAQGLFFALIAEDRLYFKVDDMTRPDFERLGMEPFRPFGEEHAMVRERYAHLSAADREALIRRLTLLRTGEMQPYYIMRYGFYEGYTEYRVDPIAIAVVFSLKPLAEIDQACDGQLDRVLTSHFQSRPTRR